MALPIHALIEMDIHVRHRAEMLSHTSRTISDSIRIYQTKRFVFVIFGITMRAELTFDQLSAFGKDVVGGILSVRGHGEE